MLKLRRAGRAQEKAVPFDFILRSSPTHSPVFSKPNVPYLFPTPLWRPFCIIPTFVVTLFSEVRRMKFVGVREFKQDVVKYLNEGNEIVVMKRKKPIARLTPVRKNSAEIILLEIGRILAEARISKKEALKALDRARREIYG
jgi:antitoxin (DNA-binding transcriptional repressor) of toxin-antitoxin stability system